MNAPFASPPQTATVTLSTLAREALRASDGDVSFAIDSLTARLMSDPKTLRAILATVVRDAVGDHIGHAHRNNRASIIQVATSRRASVFALAGGITAALLDMPLAGGLRLRNADRHAVVAQAERYETFSRDTGHKARWLRSIAPLVPAGSVVGDVLDETRVLSLWQEAA